MSAIGDRASGALARLGWSRLAALVGGRVAEFDCNFETDSKLQDLIRRPDGKRYHRESIGRVRRGLRDAGMIKSERVFMGARMPGAKFASARGTTLKTFNWRGVSERNPLSRRQRRAARVAQCVALREAGELVKPLPSCSRPRPVDEPRHSAPVRTPTPALSPDMAEAIREARQAVERRDATAGVRNGLAPSRSSAVAKPPPD